VDRIIVQNTAFLSMALQALQRHDFALDAEVIPSCVFSKFVLRLVGRPSFLDRFYFGVVDSQ
jgi:hypothetical protein